MAATTVIVTSRCLKRSSTNPDRATTPKKSGWVTVLSLVSVAMTARHRTVAMFQARVAQGPLRVGMTRFQSTRDAATSTVPKTAAGMRNKALPKTFSRTAWAPMMTMTTQPTATDLRKRCRPEPEERLKIDQWEVSAEAVSIVLFQFGSAI